MSPHFLRFLFECFAAGTGLFASTGGVLSLSLMLGRSTPFAGGGECTDESGESDMTSREGERCLDVDVGELTEGESSGAGGGGRTKSNTRVAI